MKKLTYEQLIALSENQQKIFLLELMDQYPGVSMSDIGHGLRARTEQIRELFRRLDLHLYPAKSDIDDKTITNNKKAFIGFMLSHDKKQEEPKPEPDVKGIDISKWAEEKHNKPPKFKITETDDGGIQIIGPEKPVEALKFVPFGEHSFKQVDLTIVHEIVDTMIGMTDGDVNTMKIRIEGGEELHFDLEKKRNKKESLSDWVKGVLTYIAYFNGQDLKVDLWFALS